MIAGCGQPFSELKPAGQQGCNQAVEDDGHQDGEKHQSLHPACPQNSRLLQTQGKQAGGGGADNPPGRHPAQEYLLGPGETGTNAAQDHRQGTHHQHQTQHTDNASPAQGDEIGQGHVRSQKGEQEGDGKLGQLVELGFQAPQPGFQKGAHHKAGHGGGR